MRIPLILSLLTGALMSVAQPVVSLDSCRAMALRNNKEIRRADIEIEKAGYQRQEAHAAYLPNIDFQASYLFNQKKVSLIEEDALLPVKTFSLESQGYEFKVVTNPMTGEPILNNGQPIPQQVALLPKSAMTYTIHNIMAAAVTVTQPIYMGGKIKAMNEITRYAEQIAQSMRDNKAQEVIYDVDAAYWQVVSLKAKQRLAQSYVDLVKSLQNDVNKMLAEGVATRATLLSVDVRLNEAQVAQTKVDNGLALSRMLLAQLCGLPVDSDLHLVDEDRETVATESLRPTNYDLNQVYARRNDIHALELATEVYDQKIKVARSEMLPQVAAFGAYHATNPNSYNGFKNRFGLAFSIGAMVRVPIWHGGGLSSKVKQAQADAKAKRLELDDVKEKVSLQVSQANFRYQEALKTYNATKANLDKANENLRVAQVAFKEGVGTSDDVMTAQTAWLMANSEKIDAEIDVRLCDTYLSKVLGEPLH